MDVTTQQQKKIEGVCKKVKDYLDIRFAHASRINPKIAHTYEDLVFPQIESVRNLLGSSKAFGPIKFVVVEILVGDDDNKRKALFSPTDQNSMMNEILNLRDKDDKKKTAGTLDIKDLMTYYKAIDPSLEKIVELVQTWIWWDLGDACDLYHFENQAARIAHLRDNELTDNIIDYYKKTYKKAAEEITKEFILAVEIEKLEHLCDRFEAQRKLEEGYQQIFKRDEAPNTNVDQLIINVSKRLMAVEKVKSSQVLEPAIKDYYSKTMAVPPGEITKERILEYEDRIIREMKQQIAKAITENRILGLPYNYKLLQLKTIKEQFVKLENTMPFLKKQLEQLHEQEKEEKEAQKRAAQYY